MPRLIPPSTGGGVLHDVFRPGAGLAFADDGTTLNVVGGGGSGIGATGATGAARTRA